MTSRKSEAATAGPTLMGALRHLWDFWSQEGCIFLPPCDFALPAGTLHPEAFFRLQGPNPWRSMLMQPVRRPLDARRGEHPYRFSRPLQFVVLLKPAPADGQDLFLASLRAMGIDLEHHDLRFVETAWRSRTLGAYGAGWSAQLDGLGIGRLTYLRQAANRDLETPAFEMTYGLERLLLIVRGGKSAGENPWSSSDFTYGDLRRDSEEEHARYVLAEADTSFWRRRLAGLEEEARRCIEADLPRTAYEVTLRGLLGIDILTTRGEISLREREVWLDQLQALVVAAAGLVAGISSGLEAPEDKPNDGEDNPPETAEETTEEADDGE